MPIHIYPPIESNYDWKVEKVEQGMRILRISCRDKIEGNARGMVLIVKESGRNLMNICCGKRRKVEICKNFRVCSRKYF